MSGDDRDYFRARAEAELEAAMKAVHPDAARAHYLLAGYYLDRAYNPSASSSWVSAEAEFAWEDAAPVTGGAAFA